MTFQRTFIAILAAAASIVATLPAKAQTLVSQVSAHDVKTTIDRLAKALEERGIKVAARVDHAAGAKAAGMSLPPTEVIIFGNPKLGTPLMQANPAIGIDLPMKVMAWQAADGKTMIGYTAPADLKAKYGVTGQDAVFDAMTQALAGLTKAAAAK